MIIIPSNFLKLDEISNDEVVAYVFLQIHTYSANYDSCQFAIPHVVDQITGITKSHSTYEKMAKAIKGLISKGMLMVTQENSKCWRIFMDSFKLPEQGGFVKVDAENLRMVMDCQARGKATVLRYYLLVLSYIHPGTKVCMRSEDFFAEKLHVSVKSIMTYNKHLENMKLIYILRSRDRLVPNLMGRYEDKDAIEQEATKRKYNRGRMDKANESRRYIMMYHNAINGYPYDHKTLLEIRDFMQRRNRDMNGEGYDLKPLIAKINQIV